MIRYVVIEIHYAFPVYAYYILSQISAKFWCNVIRQSVQLWMIAPSWHWNANLCKTDNKHSSYKKKPEQECWNVINLLLERFSVKWIPSHILECLKYFGTCVLWSSSMSINGFWAITNHVQKLKDGVSNIQISEIKRLNLIFNGSLILGYE